MARTADPGTARAAFLALMALFLFAVAFAAKPAQALDLDQARAAGLVGETARGYIAAVETPTPEVTALVNQVNAARRQAYQRIASQTGAALEQVEVLTAQRIYEKVPPGTFVQSTGGQWTQKP